RLVMAKVVGRIVSRAHHLNPELAQNSLRGQILGQRSVGALPNGRSRLLIEKVVDAEISLQFQMRPVVERIAQGVGNGSGPGQKLIVMRGLSGDISFGDSVGPHGAPFVMVALEPDFVEIGKTAILGDVFGAKMTVVVDNGLRPSALMIKSLGDLI